LLGFLVAFAAPAFAQGEGEGEGEPDGPCGNGVFIGADDGCDCGCGVPDPDCEDTTIAGCVFNGCVGAFDDPANVPTEADPTQCAVNACGDLVTAGAEICDDGDAAAGGGCSADCTTVEDGFVCGDFLFGAFAGCHEIVCNDGLIEGDETCDDGNVAPGDGCDAACVTEDGFFCPEVGVACHPLVCGDNVAEGPEECDDGNTTPGDGCDATCIREVPDSWVCNRGFFGTADGCDCGCGAIDPDCAETGGGCAEGGCFVEGCGFCYDDAGVSTGCPGAEGEGEGEGAGEEGEGEGGGDEGEGENGGRDETDDPDRDEGCGQYGQGVPATFAMILAAVSLVVGRRRRAR